MKRFVQACVGIIAVAALSGCGGVKRDVEDAINAELAKDTGCWSPKGGAEKVKFPFNIALGFQGIPRELFALEKAGMISVGAGQNVDILNYQKFAVIDLTEAGKKADVWSDKGFCIGSPRVVEILRFKEETDNVMADFSWERAESPDWAKAHLDDPGMREPVEASAVLEKYSDGYKVISIR
jgi:hypothetical protein